MSEILIESEQKSEQPNNITVKFIINQYETVAQVYAATTTVGRVLKDISSKFKLPCKYVTLRRDDHLASKIPSGTQLHQICINKIGIVNVTLRLSELANEINESANNDNQRIKLDCDVYYRHYQLPDFISVSIPSDAVDEPTKRVIVEIINIPIVKPFVGGFLNRKTSIEYHNAYTQTGPLLQNMKLTNFVTRDTQTAILASIGATINDFRERETQTADTSGCQPSSRTLDAKKYVSFEEFQKSEIKKIILIQRNWRRCLWQRLIKKSAHEWRQIQLEEDERRMAHEQTMLGKFMYKCGMAKSPRTRRDFEMLLAHVHQWKETEASRIHDLYQGDDASKSVAYNRLVDEEVKLINEIRAKRRKLLNEQQSNKMEKMLDKLGAPIKWFGYKNIECEMDLLRTQKTRQLTALYRQLKSAMQKHDRIEFVMRLSDVLKKETASGILDALTELLDRERVLLVSDFDDAVLQTLRQRQNELLANYIGGEKLFDGIRGIRNELNTKVCSKCRAIRSANDFNLNSRDGESHICRMCMDLLVPSADMTIYRCILRSIRRDERKRNAISSCAFIIQDEDIRVIMDQIWHGHSVLSQNNDLKILRLPRWNRALDWSPWNCVCLTDTETFAHDKIKKSLDEIYGAQLINMVHCNQKLARKTFHRLMNINAEFVESGEWDEVGLH